MNKPDTVFKAFGESLGADISHCSACITLYNSFSQHKGETAAM